MHPHPVNIAQRDSAKSTIVFPEKFAKNSLINKSYRKFGAKLLNLAVNTYEKLSSDVQLSAKFFLKGYMRRLNELKIMDK